MSQMTPWSLFLQNPVFLAKTLFSPLFMASWSSLPLELRWNRGSGRNAPSPSWEGASEDSFTGDENWKIFSKQVMNWEYFLSFKAQVSSQCSGRSSRGSQYNWTPCTGETHHSTSSLHKPSFTPLLRKNTFQSAFAGLPTTPCVDDSRAARVHGN